MNCPFTIARPTCPFALAASACGAIAHAAQLRIDLHLPVRTTGKPQQPRHARRRHRRCAQGQRHRRKDRSPHPASARRSSPLRALLTRAGFSTSLPPLANKCACKSRYVSPRHRQPRRVQRQVCIRIVHETEWQLRYPRTTAWDASGAAGTATGLRISGATAAGLCTTIPRRIAGGIERCNSRQHAGRHRDAWTFKFPLSVRTGDHAAVTLPDTSPERGIDRQLPQIKPAQPKSGVAHMRVHHDIAHIRQRPPRQGRKVSQIRRVHIDLQIVAQPASSSTAPCRAPPGWRWRPAR